MIGVATLGGGFARSTVPDIFALFGNLCWHRNDRFAALGILPVSCGIPIHCLVTFGICVKKVGVANLGLNFKRLIL